MPAEIPAKFVMLSGSEDQQTSADVFNVDEFNLPHTAGKAGGACTSALLKVMNEFKEEELSWLEVLQKMRTVLEDKGYDQIPQLSASRFLDADDRFEIVPQRSVYENTARRAVLIGINYTGQDGQLSGCQNDVENIKRFLIKEQGFQEKDLLILVDDGKHYAPTRKNILDSFAKICQYSEAGDVVFVHYSGHGELMLLLLLLLLLKLSSCFLIIIYDDLLIFCDLFYKTGGRRRDTNGE